jgi:autotransporter family porin
MSTLSISGGGAHGAFATLTGQLTINTATVTAVGGGSHGLASFGAGSFLFARNVTINTSGLGGFGAWTDNSGTLVLDAGHITTSGTNGTGVRVGLVPGGIGGGSLTVSNTIIETSGTGASGIRVTDNDSRVIASNMTITTRSNNSPGLSSVGRNSLVISDSRVTTLGDSEGIRVQDRGFVSATNTQIISNSSGVLIGSGGTISNPNTVILDGGSVTSLTGDAIVVINNTRPKSSFRMAFPFLRLLAIC